MEKHNGPIVGWFGTSKDDAIAYIRENGFTQDDVKLIYDRDDDAYLVIAKRKLW